MSTQLLKAAFWPSLLSLYAYRKKSLTNSAVIFAFIIAYLHSLYSFAAFIHLAFFFVLGSKVTKVGSDLKEKREDNYLKNTQRNWIQVMSNGMASALFCIWLVALRGVMSPQTEKFLFWAFEGALFCASSDTFSSEIGILSLSLPREILDPFREVPAGSNGGVSIWGFLGSLASGILFASLNVLMQNLGWMSAINPGEPFAMNSASFAFSFFISIIGSVIDSVLGNVFEYSGWHTKKRCVVNKPGPNVEYIMGDDILDGNQVNFLSCFLTGLLSGFLSLYLL